MDDFTYDCLQRKRLAQQAKYRKCGSKSRKCPLSTDHMTAKQWRERCGKIVSINMNSAVSWDTFKELSKQTREEYIRGLMETYGANATSLAAMFNVRPLTVRRYITARELDVAFQVGHSMNAQQKLAWEDFLNGGKSVAEPVREDSLEQIVSSKQVDGMRMNRVSICFKGQIDVNAIANSLRNLLGDSAKGEVEIACSLW